MPDEIEIRLSFSPDEITMDDEAYPAFKAGGTVLNFWALYKNRFMTNQFFMPALEEMRRIFCEINDGERKAYQTPFEFKEMLLEAGFSQNTMMPVPDDDWIMGHWDYFNMNIQKRITLVYTKTEQVEKRMSA